MPSAAILIRPLWLVAFADSTTAARTSPASASASLLSKDVLDAVTPASSVSVKVSATATGALLPAVTARTWMLSKAPPDAPSAS